MPVSSEFLSFLRLYAEVPDGFRAGLFHAQFSDFTALWELTRILGRGTSIRKCHYTSGVIVKLKEEL